MVVSIQKQVQWLGGGIWRHQFSRVVVATVSVFDGVVHDEDNVLLGKEIIDGSVNMNKGCYKKMARF